VRVDISPSCLWKATGSEKIDFGSPRLEAPDEAADEDADDDFAGAGVGEADEGAGGWTVFGAPGDAADDAPDDVDGEAAEASTPRRKLSTRTERATRPRAWRSVAGVELGHKPNLWIDFITRTYFSRGRGRALVHRARNRPTESSGFQNSTGPFLQQQRRLQVAR